MRDSYHVTRRRIAWEPWQARAACRKPGVDPDMFFPEATSAERIAINTRGGFTRTERRAKAVCISCPVRKECLESMYSWGNQPGVWGGTLERERRAFQRTPREGRVDHLLQFMDEQAIKNGWKERVA